MKLIDCIKTRRSIRKYKDKEVSDDVIRELIDCARHAPSSCDTQPWEFVVIRDKAVREKLSQIHKFASYVKGAPVVIAICYDEKRCTYSPSNYLSSAAATENLLLTIHDKGLGSCWTYVKDFEDPEIEVKVKKILKVPDNIGVLCLLPIGYPDQKPVKRELRSVEDIVHNEKW